MKFRQLIKSKCKR